MVELPELRVWSYLLGLVIILLSVILPFVWMGIKHKNTILDGLKRRHKR